MCSLSPLSFVLSLVFLVVVAVLAYVALTKRTNPIPSVMTSFVGCIPRFVYTVRDGVLGYHEDNPLRPQDINLCKRE